MCIYFYFIILYGTRSNHWGPPAEDMPLPSYRNQQPFYCELYSERYILLYICIIKRLILQCGVIQVYSAVLVLRLRQITD
jgi:hypothetical protein